MRKEQILAGQALLNQIASAEREKNYVLGEFAVYEDKLERALSTTIGKGLNEYKTPDNNALIEELQTLQIKFLTSIKAQIELECTRKVCILEQGIKNL